ncbi:MAG: 50S ribosomal protein L4 [Clostridia bacterium]|nr:50S ribosomal protein L4 [Clostridia bacterium]
MPSIKVFNQLGAEVATKELDETVFGVEYNEALIHQVVVAQLNNARQGTKSALTRTEVRGGGIKPWRQKGTGRARQGSIRAPQWTGGGIVFAPKPRSFSQKVNKKANVAALKSALSEKVRENDVIVLEKFELTAPKTKEVATVLKALNVEKRVLLVVTDVDTDVVIAARNIPTVKVINSDLINVYDVVANEKMLATAAAIEKIEEGYRA